jgi:Spy/CpxP family protein refolding chaperone
MKSRILSIAAMLTVASASAALAQTPAAAPQQGQGQGQNRGAQRMAMMMQGITLTPAQQTQIDSIVARYTAQMPAFQPGQQRPDSAQMANRREMTMRRDREIRDVLTTDQQKVFDNNVATMRANMPQRP